MLQRGDFGPIRCSLCAAALVAAVAVGGLPASTSAQEVTISPNLANNLRYIQVVAKSGRIAATTAFAGRNMNSSTKSDDRSESMALDLTSGAPSLDYDLTTSTFRIVIDMDRGETIRIRRMPQNDSKVKPLEFFQPAEGALTVKVGAAPNERTIKADSLWHLFAAEPELARTDLEPLLRMLRQGWPLVLTSQSIEQTLYRRVDTNRSYDRVRWSDLVAQLRSEKYVERLEADRRLRELGQMVVPYLRNLDSRQLDAEQAFRIRMIVRSYAGERGEDVGESAADWLSADPEYWYALATRATGPQRPKVKIQLEQLLGAEVIFDEEAKDEVLKQQLAKIREQIDQVQRTSAK